MTEDVDRGRHVLLHQVPARLQMSRARRPRSIGPRVAAIAARGASLRETIDAGVRRGEPPPGSEDAAAGARLERWCEAAAAGDGARFERRLAWEGLDRTSARRLLAAPASGLLHRLAWVTTLESLTGALSPDRRAREEIEAELSRGRPLGKARPMPFEEVWQPVCAFARRELRRRLGIEREGVSPSGLFEDDAWLDLERGLLQALVRQSAFVLQRELTAARPLGGLLLGLLPADDRETRSRARYEGFVASTQRDGLLDLFTRYPSLARSIAIRVKDWIDATAALALRLAADREELGAVMGRTADRVVEATPGLSDPHGGGRTVVALRFASGLRVVYKPKRLYLEAVFGTILEWCEQHGGPLAPAPTLVLPRATHGWSAFLEPAPCADRAAVQRYYARAGALTCLLHLLDGTDCHHENLLARGEHPTLLDHETLLHQGFAPGDPVDAMDADTRAEMRLRDSVLKTGLLPTWQHNRHSHRSFDVSGLGSVEPEQMTADAVHWRHTNTDDMCVAMGPMPYGRAARANLPRLGGEHVSADEHVSEIRRGFEAMYRFVLRRRGALLGSGSPLTALRGERVRFVLRSSRVYGSLLEMALAPDLQRDGVERSFEFERLARPFVATAEAAKDRAVFFEEALALERGDVPLFSSRACGRGLWCEGRRVVPDYFASPAYERMRARLGRMDDDDMRLQTTLIEGAFAARAARIRPESGCAAARPSRVDALSGDELLHEASRLAELIQRHAIRQRESAGWIGIVHRPEADRFALHVLGPTLYDGTLGIALFLAALDDTRGTSEHRDLVHAILRPLRRMLARDDLPVRHGMAMGLGSGVGALIHSLVRLARLLGDADLADDAERASRLVSEEALKQDRALDVLGGSAGVILALLSLKRERPESDSLTRARAAAEHLLAQRVGSPSAWPCSGGPPLTGYSHGAAGIAQALARLGAELGEATYLDAAAEGFAYERGLFSPAEANWPDLRPDVALDGKAAYMKTWCHGAPGIGLARLAALAITSVRDRAELRRELETALRTTLACGLGAVDNLCCGNLGRADILLLSGVRLGREDLVSAAGEIVHAVVHRARREGAYRLFQSFQSRVFNPGLFQGAAGIGYGLLRFVRPALPSVLLCE